MRIAEPRKTPYCYNKFRTTAKLRFPYSFLQFLNFLLCLSALPPESAELLSQIRVLGAIFQLIPGALELQIQLISPGLRSLKLRLQMCHLVLQQVLSVLQFMILLLATIKSVLHDLKIIHMSNLDTLQ